jgi:hypothetical protein
MKKYAKSEIVKGAKLTKYFIHTTRFILFWDRKATYLVT